MRKTFVAFLSVAAVSALGAQQQQIPIRKTTATQARSSEKLGRIFGVRHLPGGKVLLNDADNRRVLLFDSTLTRYTVVIDSTSGAPNSYGPRATPFIPYLADTTLFVDAASQSLLVIDPQGKIARVAAAPKPEDLPYLTMGSASADGRGRLVYRGMALPERVRDPKTGAMTMGNTPDSAPILRADFNSRTVDTIARVKQQAGSRITMQPDADGKLVGKRTVNPLSSVDEWGVTSDGSVALVRGIDYHIDWIGADDSHSASGKMPFDWKRLTDEDKQKLIDSAKTAQADLDAKRAEAAKNPANAAAGGASDKVAVEGMRVMMSAGGGGGMERSVMPAGAGPMSFNMNNVITEYVPLSQMPDYFPPIRAGAVKNDMDGNLWILPTTSAQSQNGELIYDVVNRKGELDYRVRIPEGRSVAGFGKGGIVYLMQRDEATKSWTLERTRVSELVKSAQ